MGEQRAGERGLSAAAAAAGFGGSQMVDTELSNTPRTFTGLHSEWKTWSFDFETYVFAVYPRLGDLLNQASMTADALAAQRELGAALNAQPCGQGRGQKGSERRRTRGVVATAQGVRAEGGESLRGYAGPCRSMRVR
eukprot:2355361-Pyramimonas_sp.AAC.1